METDKIRRLAGMLHKNNSPETRAYVEKQLQELGLDIEHIHQALKMKDPFLEAYWEEGVSNLSSQIHSHDFCEIAYCQSNCGAEYQIEDARYRLQRGDVVIVPPEVSHATLRRDNEEEPYRGYLLWISNHYFEELMAMFPFFQNPREPKGVLIRTSGTVWEGVGELFRVIVAESELRAPGWESTVAGCAAVLMTQLRRAMSEGAQLQPQEEKAELLTQILAYVEANMAQKITTEDIARRFWVSQSTIAHLFSKKMGVSFYKYVTQRRLSEAKNLMREGMPMEKIAAKVGFGDYSAFYRAFKNEFGVSPRQFLKETEALAGV